MRTTEKVLQIALFLKTSKFLPASVSTYILSLVWLGLLRRRRLQWSGVLWLEQAKGAEHCG